MSDGMMEAERAAERYRERLVQERMNPSTHTPGPWKVHEPNGVGNGFLIEADGDWPRLPSAWIGSRTRDVEQFANVRLMASAPELIDVLQRLYDYCGAPSSKNVDDWRKAMDDALDIMRKARGE
jgi:hypothetical protein